MKKPLTGKVTFLPKLEQYSNNVTHIPAQSARQTTAVGSIILSLPKINSSSNSDITLSQNPSNSGIRLNSTKRLTIQIPPVSGDNVHIPPSSTREKLPKASHHHSSTNSRTASSLSSKSRNRSLTEQLSDHSLLVPICNSYGGPVVGQPTRLGSDEQLIEGSPRKSSKAECTGIHGVHSEDGEREEGILVVMPAIGNLSASRFNELKQTNGTSSAYSLPPSIGGSRKLRRGSLVMPGDKPMKRCISLRVNLKKLLRQCHTCGVSVLPSIL